MNRTDDRRQQLIRSGLALGQSARDAGERHLLPWRRLAVQLSPLIGETGLSALYGRGTRLLASRFGWLSITQVTQSTEALLATLQGDLDAAGAADADAANAALLDTFTQLLAGLIGEALTIRLLIAAWGDERDGAEEQK